MKNSFESPMGGPKVPIDQGPIFDEQKEEDKMLLQGLRELLEKEEDPVAQYALVEKIVDLEMKEYYEEEINIQEDETISPITEPTKDNNSENESVWEDIGYHKGLTNKEFPHLSKSKKSPEEKEIARKKAIEKELKKRRGRDGHIGYTDPLDPTL